MRQGEEGDEAKRERREQGEKSGWTVLSSNVKSLKHKGRVKKKGEVCRCCGSRRGNVERKTGMKGSRERREITVRVSSWHLESC